MAKNVDIDACSKEPSKQNTDWPTAIKQWVPSRGGFLPTQALICDLFSFRIVFAPTLWYYQHWTLTTAIKYFAEFDFRLLCFSLFQLSSSLPPSVACKYLSFWTHRSNFLFLISYHIHDSSGNLPIQDGAGIVYTTRLSNHSILRKAGLLWSPFTPFYNVRNVFSPPALRWLFPTALPEIMQL